MTAQVVDLLTLNRYFHGKVPWTHQDFRPLKLLPIKTNLKINKIHI
jgi:hypothetical protein